MREQKVTDTGVKLRPPFLPLPTWRLASSKLGTCDSVSSLKSEGDDSLCLIGLLWQICKHTGVPARWGQGSEQGLA